jgi:hypothetical protein
VRTSISSRLFFMKISASLKAVSSLIIFALVSVILLWISLSYSYKLSISLFNSPRPPLGSLFWSPSLNVVSWIICFSPCTSYTFMSSISLLKS